ncbi:hypothetical protein [Chamaesiphon polymorphus]|uniref:Uncharacterized protein n=1 Tax=Chamaesiphon polymorphus CCALA 037 TaxID=2107692 RepID=A0A2T1FX63_9CYAN|nr:hypothetical protein [Chamaesiphon polymorphus]PSB49571.1 hypothetical protein C7B77_23445 [Chamaesiphon polymorphus CCALA 037]
MPSVAPSQKIAAISLLSRTGALLAKFVRSGSPIVARTQSTAHYGRFPRSDKVRWQGFTRMAFCYLSIYLQI